MSWSNERTNVVADKFGFTMTVRCRLTEKALGTRPNNNEIHRDFVASKAPDALTMEEEIARDGVEAVANKATTVFPTGVFWKTPDDVFYDFLDITGKYELCKKDGTPFSWPVDANKNIITRHPGVSLYFDENGTAIPYYINGTDKTNLVPGEFVTVPFMWDYQMRGSFKESIGMLTRAGKGAKEDSIVIDTEAINNGADIQEAIVNPAELETAAPAETAVTEEAPKKRKRRTKEEIAADKARKEAEKAAKAAAKEAAKAAKAPKYKSCEIKAFRKVVDGGWFVAERRIPFLVPEQWMDDNGVIHDTYITNPDGSKSLTLFERPLRAETMQGPRVTLVSSEMVPAGTEFYFTVRLANAADKAAFVEVMDFKQFVGMFQWRSGGMGTLIWTPADSAGKPIDIDVTTM